MKTYAIYNDEISEKTDISVFLEKIKCKSDIINPEIDPDWHVLFVDTNDDMVKYTREDTAISKMDKTFYKDHKDVIAEYVDTNQRGQLDFSDLSTKFEFYKHISQLQAILFIAGVYSLNDGPKVVLIDLSFNNIEKLKFSFGILFPELKSIDFSGNPIANEKKPDSCYSNYTILTSKKAPPNMNPALKIEKKNQAIIRTSKPRNYAIYNKNINEGTNIQSFLSITIKNDQICEELEPTLDLHWHLIFVSTDINLAQFNSDVTSITTFDMPFFASNKDIIAEYVNTNFQMGKIDLSDLESKFSTKFIHLSQLPTLLYIVGIYSTSTGRQITLIDLSYNNITKFKFSFKILFPYLKTIDFSGNSIAQETPDPCYSQYTILKQNPRHPKVTIPPKKPTEPVSFTKPISKNLPTMSKSKMFAIYNQIISERTDVKEFLFNTINNKEICDSLEPITDYCAISMILAESIYNLAIYNNKTTAIIAFDRPFFEENAEEIDQFFRDNFSNYILNFSDLINRFPKFEYLNRIPTILFITAIIALDSGKKVKAINLSNNKITKLKLSFNVLFPYLEFIDISNNPIENDNKPDPCYSSYLKSKPASFVSSSPSSSTSKFDTTSSKTSSFGPKTSSFGPKTSSFGPKTSSFGPKTSSFEPKTSSFEPKTSSFGPKTSSFGLKLDSSSSKKVSFLPGTVLPKFLPKTTVYAIFSPEITKENDIQQFLNDTFKNEDVIKNLTAANDFNSYSIYAKSNYDLYLYNNQNTGITSIDYDFLRNYRGYLCNYAKNNIKDGALDLSKLNEKIPAFNNPNLISTVLYAIGVYTYTNKIKVILINLSSNNIQSLKFPFSVLFPFMTFINIKNNPIENDDPKDPCISIFTFVPLNNSVSTIVRKSNTTKTYAIFNKSINDKTNPKKFLSENIKEKKDLENLSNPKLYPLWHLIVVDSSIPLFKYNNKYRLVCLFDKNFFIKNLNSIQDYVSKYINDSTLYMMDLRNNFKEYEGTDQLATVLLMAGVCILNRGQEIYNVNLYYNRINNFHFNYTPVFPKIQNLDLTGNPLGYSDNRSNYVKFVKVLCYEATPSIGVNEDGDIMLGYFSFFSRNIDNFTNIQQYVRRIVDCKAIFDDIKVIQRIDNHSFFVSCHTDLEIYNNDSTAIIPFDPIFVQNHKDDILSLIDDNTPTHLDLSNLKSKLTYLENIDYYIPTILFSLGIHCYDNDNLKIESIDLNNNNLNMMQFPFEIFFPSLKTIDFFGNQLESTPHPENYYNKLNIIHNDAPSEPKIFDPDSLRSSKLFLSSQENETKSKKDKIPIVSVINEDEKETKSEKESIPQQLKPPKNDKIPIVSIINEDEKKTNIKDSIPQKLKPPKENDKIPIVSVIYEEDEEENKTNAKEEDNINTTTYYLNGNDFDFPFKFDEKKQSTHIDFHKMKKSKAETNHRLPPNRISLNDFEAIKLNIHEFPPHGFISAFFYDSWLQIEIIGDYYSSESVFSLCVHIDNRQDTIDCPSLNYYHKYSRNLLLPNTNIALGAGNIARAQSEYLFVNGFKAKPTSCTFSNFGNMFFYVFHGVFESDVIIDIDDRTQKDEKDVLVFDRSFTIQFRDDDFFISNDNMVIRMYKL